MDGNASLPDAGLTGTGIVMIVVLAICFVPLVALVVTWPGVRNFFRRLFHLGVPAAHPPVRTAP